MTIDRLIADYAPNLRFERAFKTDAEIAADIIDYCVAEVREELFTSEDVDEARDDGEHDGKESVRYDIRDILGDDSTDTEQKFKLLRAL